MTLKTVFEEMKKEMNLEGLHPLNFLKNAEEFHKIQPFFYDKKEIFWFWNKDSHRWEIVDTVDLMIALERRMTFYGQTVNNNIKNQYVEAFKRVGRVNIPKLAPKKW